MKLLAGIIVCILEAVIFLAVVVVIMGNNDTLSVYNFLTKDTYQIYYPYLISAVWISGIVCMALISMNIKNLNDSKTILAYKKQHEKISVEYANKDDIIKGLENKVKTLETALDNVLKNKDE